MFLKKFINKFNGSAQSDVKKLSNVLFLRDMKIEALEGRIEILTSIIFLRDERIESLEDENDTLRSKIANKASIVAKPTKAKKKKKKNV